ncbi:MAG: TnpV protein [Deltaproteobacteria bacterium]|nr:TnpV protein [Deltaproteobacteria bacterium]
MEITYIQRGDYLYPNITLCEDDKLPIGKYGRMRKEYLREHRPVIYNVLAVQGKLQRHLWEIDQAANERLERMMAEMKKQAGITEQLKVEDQMAWVGQMNALKQQVEEIIFAELIYC